MREARDGPGWRTVAPGSAACGIGFLLLATRGLGDSYNYDESVTVGYFVLGTSFIDAVTSQIVFNNHPAFTGQAWLVNALGGTTEAWIRLPALAAGLLCVLVVTVFAGRRWGAVSGLLAGGITATNPLFVDLSGQARGYSLAALAVAVATVALPQVHHRRAPFTLVYAAAVAVGLLAHLYVSVPLVAHGIWTALRREPSSIERWFRATLIGGGVATIAYLPMVGTMIAAAGTREGDFQRTFPEDAAEVLFGPDTMTAVGVLATIVALMTVRAWVPAVMASGALLAAVWLLVQPADLYPRFLIWVAPLLGLLLARAYEKRSLIAALGVILMVTAVPVAIARNDEPATIREVAATVAELEAAGHDVCFFGYFGESYAAYVDPMPYRAGWCDVTLVRASDEARSSLGEARSYRLRADTTVCALITARSSQRLPGLVRGCTP